MQVHVIHEIDCSVERIDPAVVEAFLDTELSDDPMLADSICAMADAMSAELHPRGVYKLFNPAICTLPPKYTEPAIKLVGTLAVLYGSAAYERMSEAEHTAMVVSTVGTDEEIARLTKLDVHSLGKWRVNASLRNLQDFYDAFSITDGAMFMPEEERVIIW